MDPHHDQRCGPGLSAGLPPAATLEFGGARFAALHAAPSAPLYRYLPPETTDVVWRERLRDVGADWLLCGHTHRPLLRRIGGVMVLNSASVGQPRDGAPLVSYAVWDDDITFMRKSYGVEAACRCLARVTVDRRGRAQLQCILRHGRG
jgi:diadenosine tetraphosphatase ApaH/serine/threonine PP2A family protein phosphatase